MHFLTKISSSQQVALKYSASYLRASLQTGLLLYPLPTPTLGWSILEGQQSVWFFPLRTTTDHSLLCKICKATETQHLLAAAASKIEEAQQCSLLCERTHLTCLGQKTMLLRKGKNPASQLVCLSPA